MSNRINTICDLIPNDVITIYDLCCDHGQIGIEAFKRNNNFRVIFVDRVDSITHALHSYIPRNSNLTVLTKDAKNLKIKSNKKDLFIIAGIGADLGIKIFDNLYAQNSEAYFLFCIHQKTEFLKEHLIKSKLGVLRNKFIFERGQGYEVFLTSALVDRPIKIFDSTIYDVTNQNHNNYLVSLRDYYKTKAIFESSDLYPRYVNQLECILKSF